MGSSSRGELRWEEAGERGVRRGPATRVRGMNGRGLPAVMLATLGMKASDWQPGPCQLQGGAGQGQRLSWGKKGSASF